MSLRLKVRNYRGLATVDWAPEGVCALVGPNGAGKTTLLRVVDLLREALARDFVTAVEMNEGPLDFRSRAAGNAPVEFEIATGDQRWVVQPQSHGTYLGRRPREVVWIHDTALWLEREAGAEKFRLLGEAGAEMPCGDALALEIAQKMDAGEKKILEPLHALVSGYKYHSTYRLHDLRTNGSSAGSATRLSQHGSNAFAVLQTWHGKRGDPSRRFEFVIEVLRSCFPDYFQDLEFASFGSRVTCRVITKYGGEPFDVVHAPDGWLTALLHLTALVTCPDGGVVAIDEPENALHPHAIRRLVEAFRDWSAEHDVTVLLATHSPVLLDCFDDAPDQVFVLQPGKATQPAALDTLRKREWLSHFRLGALYGEQKFGAPKSDDTP